MEVKKGIKQGQAMDRQDFMQMAMENRQMGEEDVARWQAAV
jgi:hypothetical protein